MTNKTIIFLSLIFILFSISVFADNFVQIDNATLLNYNVFFKNENNLGAEKVADTYYISYLKTTNTYRKQYVASSSDFVNWNIVNLDDSDIHQEICFLFRDNTGDLACIWDYDTNSLYYYLKKNGENWNLNRTEISTSSMYFTENTYSSTSDVLANFKYKNGYLNLYTKNFFNHQEIMEYAINFENDYFTSSEINLGVADTTPSDTQTDIYLEGTNYEKLNSIGTSQYYQEQESGTWQSKENLGVKYSYINSFYYKTTGTYDYFIYVSANDYNLYYIQKNKLTGVWSSSILLNLIHSVYPDFSLSIVEGTNNLWGVYIDDIQELRVFKIPKTTPLAISNEYIIDSDTGSIDWLGQLIGQKQVNSTSLLLYDDFLVVPYIDNGKLKVTKYDTNDGLNIDAGVGIETGETNCDLKPAIVNINSSNPNPICWQQNDAKIVYLDVNTQYECPSYIYKYCENCSTNLENPNLLGYEDFFNLGESNNATERGWASFTTIPIKYTGNNAFGYVGLLNETGGEILHCIKDVAFNSCSPFYDDSNIHYVLEVNDKMFDNTYNALDIRTKDSSGNYVNILMYNCSTSNQLEVYAFYSSSYHLLYTDTSCNPIRTLIQNNMITDNYILNLDTDTNGDFDVVLSSIPFATATTNIKYFGLYTEYPLDVCNALQDSLGCNWIDTIMIDLINQFSPIPSTDWHEVANPIQIGYVNQGDYTTQLCVENPNLFYDNIDCILYNAKVRECNITELADDGIFLPINAENDTYFSSGDVAYDFIAWLNSVGIRSVASKMFLAMLIMMIMSLIGFVISQGNLIVSGVVAVLSLIACVYLGLMPLWVIVLLVVLSAGIIALFFSSKG